MNSDSFMKDKSLGSPAFFTVDITIDDKNSSQYILEVSIPLKFSWQKSGHHILYIVYSPHSQVAQSGLTLPSRDSYLDNRTAPDVISLCVH